jgi:2,3-bisphosphoglycerate-dependent phosphoglycerate mutase
VASPFYVLTNPQKITILPGMKLVLIRHGQSLWNLENRFTGWVDVPLTALGEKEARKAGRILLKENFEFDVVYTSVLQRAIKTSWLVLEELGQMWLPQHKSWRLNERHYGGLQGLNKSETKEKYGEDQVKIWRRSYDVLPPKPSAEINQQYAKDRRYQGLTLPPGEALKQTVERVLPYWQEVILPELQKQQRVLVVAHGNSLRALVKHLAKMSDQEIVEFEFETGVPLVCELNEKFELTSKTFLKES